jgi:hypothetical protein
VGSGALLSLDGGRILSNGIVSGATFAVAPLEQADFRFGSCDVAGGVSTAGLTGAC